MAQAQFPQIPDLELPASERIGDGVNKTFGKWSVSNPHPGYGKDPNIMNELGHTVYPKWVKGKIANNAEEEAEINGDKPAATGWK